MCTNRKIILHPAAEKMSVMFPHYSIPCETRSGRLSHLDFPGSSPRAVFNKHRNAITLDNVDDFLMVDEESGNTHPLCLVVDCYKCDECVGKRVSQLSNAIKLEIAATGIRPWFLTLTYDDFHLPSDGVNPEHVKLFLKRLRSRLKYSYPDIPPFRVYYVSEYTDKGRAHYHMLIFGLDALRYMSLTSFNTIIKDCWPAGFIYNKSCDAGVARYVSKYMYKSDNVPPGKNPNFKHGSISGGGIGCPCVTKFDFIKQLLDGTDNTVEVSLFGRVQKIRVPTRIIKRAFGCTLDIARHRYGKFVRDLLYDCLLFRSDPRFKKYFPDRKYFSDFDFCELDLVKVSYSDIKYFRMIPESELIQRGNLVHKRLVMLKKIELDLENWVSSSYLCDMVMHRIRESVAQSEIDYHCYQLEAQQTRNAPERHT